MDRPAPRTATGEREASPRPELRHHVERVLALLGEDPHREGLLATPQRVADSLSWLTRGYEEDPEVVVNGALFAAETQQMVICRDIDFFSLCEHHLLPFFGRCHVAYIPRAKILGLSKIARIVEVYARRLQVQERLTREIAETLSRILHPLGVAVMMEATHLCMVMRGVEKQNSKAVTSAVLGAFDTNPATRAEFLSLVKGP